MFSWVNKIWKGRECRGEGCRLTSCPEPGAHAGRRGSLLFEVGGETRRTTRFVPEWKPSGFTGGPRERWPSSVKWLLPRSTGKIFFSPYHRPSWPWIFGVIYRGLQALFAKRGSRKRLLPARFFPSCLLVHSTCDLRLRHCIQFGGGRVEK